MVAKYSNSSHPSFLTTSSRCRRNQDRVSTFRRQPARDHRRHRADRSLHLLAPGYSLSGYTPGMVLESKVRCGLVLPLAPYSRDTASATSSAFSSILFGIGYANVTP